MWKQKQATIEYIVSIGVNVLQEWRRENNGEGNQSQDTLCRTWIKPPMGCLKANVDAAIFPGNQGAGLGCVVHDLDGCCKGYRIHNVIGIEDLKIAEALSVREALFWLLQFNIPTLIMESDVQVVIEALSISVNC